MSEAEAIFLPDGPGRFVPTELARGPWDPQAQHGGAPAGLLAGALERVESAGPMTVMRLTYEFLRPVPLAPLTVVTEVTRPGRRVQLVQARLLAGETEVCRATALRVRSDDVPAPPPPVPAPGYEPRKAPEESAPLSMPQFADAPPMFAGSGMELRFSDGTFAELGPATAWFRLRVPLVAGQSPSPLQRLAAAADFGNGISAAVPWDSHLFINPDLTIYVERLPEGDWVGLDSATRIGAAGSGLTDGVLFDARGRVGRALQALYVDQRVESAGADSRAGSAGAEPAST